MAENILIPYKNLQQYFYNVLDQHAFAKDRAEIIAKIFADSTADGFHSHGANRFPEFIHNVREGHINKDVSPKLTMANGFIERYDGQLGAGPFNAHFCMDRAIHLAKAKGMACVALRNNNHWMRGGSYGWQAADAGCISICFTNTQPNMVPWGAKNARTGNNPLIIAIPRESGHLVFDSSMSQFSYGQMKNYARRGEQLPFNGGFDANGKLTTDPTAIIDSMSALPIGYWKGGGLSIMLNAMAAVLAAGKDTGEIGNYAIEYNLSQVFIVIDASSINTEQIHEEITNQVVDYINASQPLNEGGRVTFPGERTLQRRKKNMSEGIPIDKDVWAGLQSLLKP